MARETDPITLAKNAKELRMERQTYKIIRMHRNDSSKDYVVVRGLERWQAQMHCRDPQTSSSTCTSETLVEYTKENGPWFDGFEIDS